ncbi:MAG TPA: aspartate-semialdehyde dehydrogenase [Longimicrobiaceae bacterium]|nr:aspartate-semialdehyde dehydrogenase [Longimicrobiaceae bacterium]
MHIAVVGATGAVGRTMLEVLAERALPVDKLTLLASPKSVGKRLHWKGEDCMVAAPEEGCFRGVDVALFSAGAERSRELAPKAVEEGAIVVDNSSAWRMDPEVPLVVPEVNASAIGERPKGIIANPNCSTIQTVIALKPLHQAAGLRRVVVTTFQSVSGAGEQGRERLRTEAAGEPFEPGPFARPISGNVLPKIGDFDAEGWTTEERKMANETRKILGLPDLAVSATCVRVPVDVGHAVQVMVELEKDLTMAEAYRALAVFPGTRIGENPEDFPTPLEVAGNDTVFVGRLRLDADLPRVLHLWVVADNLRKGAATNAVQIVERIAGG